jgi:hypothetical protein
VLATRVTSEGRTSLWIPGRTLTGASDRQSWSVRELRRASEDRQSFLAVEVPYLEVRTGGALGKPSGETDGRRYGP